MCAAKTADLGQGARQRTPAGFVFSELDNDFGRGQERAPGAGCLGAVLLGACLVVSWWW